MSRVQTVLQRAGVKLRGRHERLPFPVAQLAIPPERMAELYRAGTSIEKVAAQAGVPSTRAAKLLREWGVALRHRPPKQGPRLPPETIASRYRAGESAGDLAKEAGIKLPEIRAILVAFGEELRPPLGTAQGRLEDRWFSPKKIVQLYEEGATVQSLAKTLGVSLEMIRTLLLKRGVKLRGRGGQPSAEPSELVADPGEVARLYRAGHAIKEVAAAMGCTAWQVRTVLLKLGVKLRGRAGNRGDDFRPPPMPAETVAALYAAGAGLERVAAKAGVSRKKAKRMLRDQQVPLRGRAEATRHPEQSRNISDQTVVRRYRAGATLESLAIAAGSNAPVIRRILADQGVALRPMLAQLNIPEERIASLYRDGSSLGNIAALAGCSRAVIRRILRRDGVAIRNAIELNIQRGVKPRITVEAMQARYETGSSLSQIAAAAGIHLARVATILHRRGMKLRGRGATPLADTERVKIPPEKMVELYLAGKTILQITALAESNRDRITAILKRRGVKIRSRR